MSVYFVYRSHYDNPGAFHVKVFPQDTVLEWFQSIWRGIPAPETFSPPFAFNEYAEELLGQHVYSFGSLFTYIHEHRVPSPQTMSQLAGVLRGALYDNDLKFGGHHIQWVMDDDEQEIAGYFFDDHFVQTAPHRAAFLMRPDWRLPDGAAEGDFEPTRIPKAVRLVRGTGTTYFAHFAAHDGENLRELSEDLRGKVSGVRVQDFPRYLFALRNRVRENEDDETLNLTLRELLSGLDAVTESARDEEVAFLAAMTANPDDYAGWCAYCDWRMENDKPALLAEILLRYDADAGAVTRNTRDATKDTVHAQTHIAQASKHTSHWVGSWRTVDEYHHFILFDDEWANAHRDLAASILRTASRWDPL